MVVTGVILSVLLLYATFRFGMLYKEFKSQKVLMFAFSLLAYSISSLYWVINFTELSLNDKLLIDNILDWIQVVGVSFLLCGLAIENWEDRPAVARFPYVLVYAPILLIITYAFVFDTLFLKEVIIAIYEGGAILIALLLFGLLAAKNTDYLYVLVGLILMLLAFVVYLFPSEVIESNEWIWKLIVIISVYTLQKGYRFATSRALKERLTD